MDVEVHIEMTTRLGKDNGLTDAQVHILMLGSEDADKQGWSQDWHFDGRKDFAAIQEGWNKINKRIRARGDYYGLGYDIHNTQDFYAHSNYVELHVDYYKDTFHVMANYTVDSCPVYEEGIKIKVFLENYLEPKLHSGTFSLVNNEYFAPFSNKEKLGPETHYRMNKDSVLSLKGREYVEGTQIRYAELSKAVAMKATNNIIVSVERTGWTLRPPKEEDTNGNMVEARMWP